jgi:S-adenosylmethionine:tRNA ribosyltransferase-isomerase
MFAPSFYHFDVPLELIAQQPAAVRDASRLLHVHRDGTVSDHAFADLVELLPSDAVLIANDTRVIPARVLGNKPTGGAIELLFLEPEPDVAAPAGTSAWRCLARGQLRPGQTIHVADDAVEVLTDRAPDNTLTVAVPGDGFAFLDRNGHVPLPVYIDRGDTPEDRERYQTMFARVPGAVAAPTAGLHMTPAIAERLAERGIALATLTLHVGWGTFAPIRADDVRAHRMHRERYDIPAPTAALVASGRPIVALGTTALRALESAAIAPDTGQRPPDTGRAVLPGAGSTDIFIHPGSGHRFRVVDHLVTNFHLPGSTLLMLVCAFAGTEQILGAYRHAIAARYRFYSYGDATLLHRVS